MLQCHGLARGHPSSLDQITTPPLQTLPPLPTVAIGREDVLMEADSVHGLEALSDTLQLWDVPAKAKESAGKVGPGAVEA